MATSPRYLPDTIRKVFLCRVLAAIQCVSLAACGVMDGTESATSATGSPTLSGVDETSSKRRQSRLLSGGDIRTTTRTATTPTPTTTAAVTEASTPTTSSTAPSVSSPTTQTTNSATPAAAINVDASNTITIREDLGVTRTNYPIQLGRVFAQGKYTGAVQLRYNGVSIPTQTDVKNRWSDGSIRFAVLSAVIPSITALSQTTVAFESITQTSASDQTRSLATFLTANPNFDASLTAKVSGSQSTVTLRQMLNQGAVAEPWTQGPVSSTYIVADHSAQRRFDFGISALKSIRPIMHITVWHATGQARVRFIAENSNTEGLENVTYDLSLSIGAGSTAKTVFSQPVVPHHYGARWTKVAWYGNTPQPLSINYNAAYLANQRVIPNYDPIAKLTEAQINTQVTRWNGVSKGLFDSGFWNKYMPAPGGREEIALFPNWTVDALLSGDYRLQEISDAHTEMATAWPMNFREGSSTKFYDRSKTAPAIGKAVSLFARPTQFYFDNNFISESAYIADPADRYVWGASTSGSTLNGWNPDGAHQPAPFFLPYINTGEYVWLEQMQLWASWGAFNPSPNTTDGFYGRGPTVTSAGLNGDTRRQAWLLRNRVSAAAFSVDNTNEKAYYDYLVTDAIAIAEGIRGITGSLNQGNASYQWGEKIGRNGMYGGLGISPLHFWDTYPTSTESFASTYQSQWNTPIKRAQAPWQLAYMIIALAHAKDLGYPTDRLLNWAAVFITEATKSTNTAWLLGTFVLPITADYSIESFKDFGTVQALYNDPMFAESFSKNWLNSPDGYPLTMTAAVASIQDVVGGSSSWQWVKSNWVDRRTATITSRWAIIPRN
jgi:hypothetical protein